MIIAVSQAYNNSFRIILSIFLVVNLLDIEIKCVIASHSCLAYMLKHIKL